jgi:hypothetical protein
LAVEVLLNTLHSYKSEEYFSIPFCLRIFKRIQISYFEFTVTVSDCDFKKPETGKLNGSSPLILDSISIGRGKIKPVTVAARTKA